MLENTTLIKVSYPAYQVRKELKPFRTTGLSAKMLDEHWKLYEGYVTHVNHLNKMVWDVLEAGEELNNAAYSEMQRRLGFEYNGMVLHESYFGALKTGVEPNPSSPLMAKLREDFGTFERWKKQFMEMGKFRGVGWVILNYDPLLKRLQNFWTTDHETGNIAGFIPLLAMDVWEHAYVTDYGSSAAGSAGRGAYVQTFFNNIDWDVVGERLGTGLSQKPTR